MSNEDKILNVLGNIQNEIFVIKSDVASLKRNREYQPAATNNDLEVLRKMSKLLTKEEGDNLAAVFAEQTARKYHEPVIQS